MTGQHVEEAGVKDVSWINANRSEMTSEHWQDSGMDCFGMSLDGRAQATGIRRTVAIALSASDLAHVATAGHPKRWSGDAAARPQLTP